MEKANQAKLQPSYSLMTAKIYDAIYAERDYKQEADLIKKIIADHCRTNGRQLLDVACGTGNHIPFFVDDFDITGVDLSAEQLDWARQKFPGLSFKRGNMIDFQLDERYDVVTCLFSSIAYANQIGDLRRTIANMAKHLRPGGVLVIGCFLGPENYQEDRISATFIDRPELKISRMTVSKREGNQAIWDMHHMVGQPTGLQYFVEHHRLGLYSLEQYIEAIADAGLEPSCDDDSKDSGRPLISGLKPAQTD